MSNNSNQENRFQAQVLVTCILGFICAASNIWFVTNAINVSISIGCIIYFSRIFYKFISM